MSKFITMRTFYIIAAILLFTGVKDIYGGWLDQMMSILSNKKGRLLTPDEGCGYSKVAHKRIVGGTVAKDGAWPWMALLFYENETDPLCGGSLITTRHILTAAHCVLPELYKVRLGEYDIRTNDDGQHLDVYIGKAVQHGNWNPRWNIHDIGMLYLDNDVVINDRIRPVCLPITEELINRRFVGLLPFLIGWGAIRENGTSSPVPMEVQVPVIENKVCKEIFFRINSTMWNKDSQFDDRVICEGFTDGGKASCQGDSGGPLVLPIAGTKGTFPFYQIGIVSYSVGCGRPNIPGVNTNVQFYAKWIENKLNNL